MSCVGVSLDSGGLGIASPQELTLVQLEDPVHDAHPPSEQGYVVQTTLYSPSAFPNIPSGLNLLFLIPATLRLIATLRRAFCQGDKEEVVDVGMRVLGTPMNVCSSTGTLLQILKYLIQWKIVAPVAGLFFLAPFIFVFGIILCAIEIIINIINFVRVQRFCHKFNFDLFAQLKILLTNFDLDTNFDSAKGLQAVKRSSKLLKKDPEKFKSIFGDEEYPEIAKTLADMEEKIGEDPSKCVSVLRERRDTIEKMAISLMLHDLYTLRDDYLKLTDGETETICAKVREKLSGCHGDQSNLEVQKKLENALYNAHIVKKKKLARRVQPWMFQRIETQSPYIIKAFEKKICGSSDPSHYEESLPLVRGLVLFEEIEIQTVKARIILIIEIMALAVTICVFILALAGCPVVPFSVLIALSLVLCIVRFVIYRTTSGMPGWRWDMKRILPFTS